MFTLEESALLARMLRAMGLMALGAVVGVGYLLARMHAAPATPSLPVSAAPAVSVSAPAAAPAPVAPAPVAPAPVAAPPAALETVRHEDGPTAAPAAKPHRGVRTHHLHLTHTRRHHKPKLSA